jgi:hypothetical protein
VKNLLPFHPYSIQPCQKVFSKWQINVWGVFFYYDIILLEENGQICSSNVDLMIISVMIDVHWQANIEAYLAFIETKTILQFLVHHPLKNRDIGISNAIRRNDSVFSFLANYFNKCKKEDVYSRIIMWVRTMKSENVEKSIDRISRNVIFKAKQAKIIY